MTRDDHRAECIEAQAIVAFEKYNESPWASATDDEKKYWIWTMTDAFDALHGLAFVDPIEATEEMIRAGIGKVETNAWRAMSTRGNLTNPPETK